MLADTTNCGYETNVPGAGEPSYFCACGSTLKKVTERFERRALSGWLVEMRCRATDHVVERSIPLGSPPPVEGEGYRLRPIVVEAYEAEVRTVVAGPGGGYTVARPGDWIVLTNGRVYSVDMALFHELHEVVEATRGLGERSAQCRDGGTCHHRCTSETGCFRERTSSPLGGVGTWDEVEGELILPATTQPG